MLDLQDREWRFFKSLSLLTVLCLALFFIRLIFTGSARYWFIPENLALAWLALGFGWILTKRLTTDSWRTWKNIGLTILWLAFLPNCWYVITDFIHVFTTGEINQLFDIILMSLLALIGFSVGFSSLYLVHQELRRRVTPHEATGIVGIILLAASFAIYLGRILRWNTWDVITNPSGVLLNVSDRLIDPLGYQRAFNITLLFFVFLASLYWAVWTVTGPHKRSANS